MCDVNYQTTIIAQNAINYTSLWHSVIISWLSTTWPIKVSNISQ